MPFGLARSIGLQRTSNAGGAAFDHQPARCDAGHRDIRLQRMPSITHWFSRDDMDDKAPAERHIQSLGQRRQAGVRLELELVARDEDAVKAQPADADEHGRAGAVLERKAQALPPWRAEQSQTRSSLRTILYSLS